MSDFSEGWNQKMKILVILAHPDDPEFFCGGTLARWALQGHEIVYALLTSGDKGTDDPNQDPSLLARVREEEQRAAARVIGVSRVEFLHQPDGFLFPTEALRKDVVRLIRKEKPDILVGSDPLNYYPPGDTRVNHPDHRAAGQIVLDACYPAAGSPVYFPELLAEGLAPHSVKELWMSIPDRENLEVDVTDTWKIKLEALHCHRTQIGDPQAFDQRMLARHTSDSTDENPRYTERFRRIRFQ